MVYKDRQDAGRKLAESLTKYIDEEPVIIALPRGGVVIGYEVAKKLHAPLDIIVARKIGAPFQPELGVGAIAQNGIRIINSETIRLLGVTEPQIEQIIKWETSEMDRRISLYRKGLPSLNLHGKTVIVVDDGLATGISTRAAVRSVKQMHPKKIILAVPVCPHDSAEKFRQEVDDFFCLNEPADFYAVGSHYADFKQVTDEEVIDIMQMAKHIT